MTFIDFVYPKLRTPKTWVDKCLKSLASEDKQHVLILDFDLCLIRRDLALETLRNKFSYLNHLIITSKYKFSYW